MPLGATLPAGPRVEMSQLGLLPRIALLSPAPRELTAEGALIGMYCHLLCA
jgi:hypothetical protein